MKRVTSACLGSLVVVGCIRRGSAGTEILISVVLRPLLACSYGG